MAKSSTNLAEHGACLLGGQLKSSKHLAGGCIAECLQISLTDGRVAVVKNGPSTRAEADMLRAIRAAGAPAPDVLAADDKVLVMELLPTGGNLGGTKCWASVGATLAKLHTATGERYGWAVEEYAFGDLKFSNAWSDNWPEFWSERRLRAHIGHIPPEFEHRLQRLCAELPNKLPANPRPALLHGDFWSGNILIHPEEGVISGFIDPACYYGHTEVDFAMLTLFGRPTLHEAFFRTYGPLEEGYAERQPIYQLWPALVHLRLFGSAYRSWVDELLSKAGF